MATQLCADSRTAGIATNPTREVHLPRWINEPLPDVRLLLSSHDVARLTRRPRWQLIGLTVLGRFPRRRCYQGRPLGWHRDDVLAWLTRGMSVTPPRTLPRSGATRRPRQVSLPLECREQCALAVGLQPERIATAKRPVERRIANQTA